MSKKELKKVSSQQIKLSDMPVGFEVSGKLVGFTDKQISVVNEKTQELEEKTLTFAHLTDEMDNKIKVVVDRGFTTALEDAGIHEGDFFKAVKLEKVKLAKGRTMNQYDIYA